MATKKKPTPTPETEADAPASPQDRLAAIGADFMPDDDDGVRLAEAAKTGNAELLAAVRLDLGR